MKLVFAHTRYCVNSFNSLKLWTVLRRFFSLIFNFNLSCKATHMPW